MEELLAIWSLEDYETTLEELEEVLIVSTCFATLFLVNRTHLKPNMHIYLFLFLHPILSCPILHIYLNLSSLVRVFPCLLPCARANL